MAMQNHRGSMTIGRKAMGFIHTRSYHGSWFSLRVRIAFLGDRQNIARRFWDGGRRHHMGDGGRSTFFFVLGVLSLRSSLVVLRGLLLVASSLIVHGGVNWNELRFV